MPMEWPYYAVVRIRDMKVLYSGMSDLAAAVVLVPGTTHGTGKRPKTAIRKAKAEAIKHAKE